MKSLVCDNIPLCHCGSRFWPPQPCAHWLQHLLRVWSLYMELGDLNAHQKFKRMYADQGRAWCLYTTQHISEKHLRISASCKCIFNDRSLCAGFFVVVPLMSLGMNRSSRTTGQQKETPFSDHSPESIWTLMFPFFCHYGGGKKP